MGLRKKLFIFLVTLPLLTVIICSYILVYEFWSDKLDSSIMSSINNLEKRNSHLIDFTERVLVLVNRAVVTEQMNERLYSDSGFEMVAVVKEVSFSNFIQKSNMTNIDKDLLETVAIQLRDSSRRYTYFLDKGQVLLALKKGNSMIVLNVTNKFQKIFQGEDLYQNFTVDGRGEYVRLFANVKTSQGSQFFAQYPGLKDKILAGKSTSGTFFITDSRNRDKIVSYMGLPYSDLLTFEVVDRAVLFRASYRIIIRIVGLLMVVLLSSIFFSRHLSQRIAGAVIYIRDIMSNISQGNLEVDVKVTTNDELGQLTSYIGETIDNLKIHQRTQKQKHYLEQDLEVAKNVQEMFFPKPNQFKNVFGFTQMADRCGGDWYYYLNNQEQIFFILADAVGHGTPAALITSTARSVLSYVEFDKEFPQPSAILSIMNKAIFDCALGDMTMSVFACSLDLSTMQLTYANGSHDPPMLFNPDGLTSGDKVQHLVEASGPRVGSAQSLSYSDVTITVQPNDVLFIYSDGIFELEDDDGKTLRERVLIKNLLKKIKNQKNIPKLGTVLAQEFRQFHGDKPYIDDWSFLLCNFNFSKNELKKT